MPKPLEGIRVLEWAVRLNGPAAGYMLADLGADVIKIERPGVGDDFRGIIRSSGRSNILPGNRVASFEAANRGKRGITLDLKKEMGKQVLYRLVEKCDIFLTNYPRSRQAGLGADYQTLRQFNPRLIYAYNGGYGGRGSEGQARAFDQTIQSRIGFMYLSGASDSSEPIWTPGGMFDQIGATLCVYGILAALFVRERWGIGQEVEASLFGSAIHAQAYNLNRGFLRGHFTPRFSRKRCVNPLTNIYQCADGKWLLIGEDNSDRWWLIICKALDLEGLVNDPRFATVDTREENNEELISIFDRAFAARSREEWLKRFAEGDYGGFAYEPVRTMDEMATDPIAIENDYIVETDHPTVGSVKTVGTPVRFSKTPARVAALPAPELGQHTEEVLLEVGGYSWDEIAKLREDGVI